MMNWQITLIIIAVIVIPTIVITKIIKDKNKKLTDIYISKIKILSVAEDFSKITIINEGLFPLEIKGVDFYNMAKVTNSNVYYDNISLSKEEKTTIYLDIDPKSINENTYFTIRYFTMKSDKTISQKFILEDKGDNK